MGLEGLGGLEELDDERVREGVEVLGGGREAGVVGAEEGELAEADGGGEREGLAEFLDVERGVDKDYVEASLFQLEGQSQEGDYVALAHEWEHNYGFLLALRHFSSHFRFLSFFAFLSLRKIHAHKVQRRVGEFAPDLRSAGDEKSKVRFV